MSESIDVIEVTAKIARKQPDLPRFVVIRAEALAPWSLTGTTPVDVEIEGVAVLPRTVRKWDDRRWFMSITKKDCEKLGVDTGSRVAVRIRRQAVPGAG